MNPHPVMDPAAPLPPLVQALEEAVFGWNAAGEITTWNRSAERMFGRLAADALGRRRAEVIPPEVNDRLDERLAALDRVDETEAFEVRISAPGALPLEARVRGFAHRDGLGRMRGGWAIARDLSDTARLTRLLEEGEERLTFALETAGLVAWSWDVATGRVEWPVELETMLGLERGAIRGRLRDVRARIHPEDQRRVVAAVERALTGQDRYRDQYRIVLPDGRIAWLDVSGRVFRNERGEAERMIGLVSDVTERKQAELLLREAARKQDEFLAVLGHELRNPMAPIQNCLHILRMPGVPESEAHKAWTMLDRQVQHLNRIVTDLLDVSRLARGRILLREERLDLAELVQGASAEFRRSFEARDLDFEVEVPDQPVWIVGDRARLLQALGNLLHNAGKFSRRDGRVTLVLQRHHGTATITVRDEGVGMPPDLVARLFQPFVQADLGGGVPVGLGLGLTLVKALVELHRGTVEARSGGKGSEFVLRLPLERAAGAPSRFDLMQAPVMRRLRILVIEDNPDVAESMELLLGLAGHEVAVANDGRSGLEKARTFQPQVLLCDLGLPGELDGFGVGRALRDDPELSHIYRVALTGYGLTRDQQRSREAGFDTHLTKPVLYSDLERVLAAATLPPES